MIAIMLLAHLIGDYILQWDRLAAWKSRAPAGSVIHGLVVISAAVGLSRLYAPAWWPWAVFIGISHGVIDAIQPWLNKRRPPAASGLYDLARLAIDQSLHLGIILLALVWSGYVSWDSLGTVLLDELHRNHSLAVLLGYTALAMPAWVMVEFLVYGLVSGKAPDLTRSWARRNKYFGTLERWLIATCVLAGQLGLAPLMILPRLAMESRQACSSGRLRFCLAETAAGAVLAVAVGIGLHRLLTETTPASSLFAWLW